MIYKIIILSVLVTTSLCLDLQVINQWNLLDFNFPDYTFANAYRPERTAVTGFEITNDRIFIGMPRIYNGVSATLASFSRSAPLGSNPVLSAYPSWDFHEAARGVNITSCNGLISVYRFKIDTCNRLWVLDSGITASLEDFQRACPPKIVIFDLNTDRVVRTIVFPREVLRPSSLLTNLVIDESVQGTCDSSFVYITDTVAPGIIVYDSMKDVAWRVMHPSMFPDPDFSETTINGETITLMDGIVGLAHSPNLGILYYQPLATNRIFSVPTAALRKGPPAELEVLPVSLVGTKSSQGIGLAVNLKDESLVFAPFTETSVSSWNPLNNNQRLLAFDPEKLQFSADIRWMSNDGSVWVLSSRFHKYFRRSINPQDINIRVVRITEKRREKVSYKNNIFYQ